MRAASTGSSLDGRAPRVTLRLTLEYDGTGFKGWARQPGERTVEGVLRDALDAVLPGWSGLAVAGRTDAGVHATGQVASRRRERRSADRAPRRGAQRGPPRRRRRSSRAEDAPDGFHARFSATGRSYRYVVLNRRARSPLLARRALWWPRPLDDDALARVRRAARRACTTSRRSRRRRPSTRSSGARSAPSAWERRGDQLHFTVTADSFLRHMVRTLVGTMLEHGPDTIATAARGSPAGGGRDDGAARGGSTSSTCDYDGPAPS